jgi:hypothetical protein
VVQGTNTFGGADGGANYQVVPGLYVAVEQSGGGYLEQNAVSGASAEHRASITHASSTGWSVAFQDSANAELSYVYSLNEGQSWQKETIATGAGTGRWPTIFSAADGEPAVVFSHCSSGSTTVCDSGVSGVRVAKRIAGTWNVWEISGAPAATDTAALAAFELSDGSAMVAVWDSNQNDVWLGHVGLTPPTP